MTNSFSARYRLFITRSVLAEEVAAAVVGGVEGGEDVSDDAFALDAEELEILFDTVVLVAIIIIIYVFIRIREMMISFV